MELNEKITNYIELKLLIEQKVNLISPFLTHLPCQESIRAAHNSNFSKLEQMVLWASKTCYYTMQAIMQFCDSAQTFFYLQSAFTKNLTSTAFGERKIEPIYIVPRGRRRFKFLTENEEGVLVVYKIACSQSKFETNVNRFLVAVEKQETMAPSFCRFFSKMFVVPLNKKIK